MNGRQRLVLMLGAAAIGLMVLFPPWVLKHHFPPGTRRERYAGYHALWVSTSLFGDDHRFFSPTIDFTRLLIQMLAAVVITVLVAVALRDRAD